MSLNKNTFEVRTTLSRDMGLLSATLIGVGAMIGAGIFVLTGMAAGAAGPGLILAFILNGIVTLCTAMAYAELGSSFHDAGGGYLWVKEGLPQPNGFLSGWISWFAHMVACSVYSLGFGAYFAHVIKESQISIPGLNPSQLIKLLSVTIILIFSYVNFRGASETGLAGGIITGFKIIILGLFIAFGLSKIIGKPASLEHFSPFLPNGFSGIFIAMGLTFIAFEGYEIIAQCSEEVKNPKKNIPRAIFYSLAIVVPIYLLVAFVAIGAISGEGVPTWQYLGFKKEVAIVEAARQLMPYGAFILLIGGLFSTVSALNATIYSSSRVSFAMGRDYNLPKLFGNIHKKRKTPHWAILISTLFISGMALLLPIEDVASAADIMFLLLFLLVNIALINLRRTRPDLDRGFKVPFFPYVPIVGIIMILFLAIYMFNYSPIAWYVTGGWIISGILVYYFYSKEKEKEELGSEVVFAEKEIAKKEYKILVSISRIEEIQPLMRLATNLAGAKDGEIMALSVVQIPNQTPISQGNRFVGERKKILKKAYEFTNEIPISTIARMSHNISTAIIDTVEEYKTNITILGWKGYSETRFKILGETIDNVMRKCPSDILVFRFRALNKIHRIFVPTAGGPHAVLAIELARDIALSEMSRIVIGTVWDPRKGEEYREKQREWIEKTIEEVDFKGIPLERKIITSKSISRGLIEESNKSDLTIIGATNIPIWKRLFFGSIPMTVAKHSKSNIIMVRKYEGALKSWIRHFLSG
ncbi:MAG: amino acid permease [Candidatus Aminicenantia bacterium]